MATINFEIGDIAHDPYYNYTGEIIEFKNTNGVDYIILKSPKNEHPCCSKLRMQSSNDLYPSYLQLVCKKDEYKAISQIKIFGH